MFKKLKQIEKARDATDVRTIVGTVIKEQQFDVERSYIRVWFGTNVTDYIWKCRFTYGTIQNMAKTERAILIMVLIHYTAKEIW